MKRSIAAAAVIVVVVVETTMCFGEGFCSRSNSISRSTGNVFKTMF